MHKIGILGNGFVGSAVASGFALHADVRVYDIDPKKSIHSFEEVMESEFIFICVPTPMNINNSNKIDLSMVTSAFKKIATYEKPLNEKIFILKSTVIPGTTNALVKQFSNLEIVFNPEFLTERSARLDFINASRIVLGGTEEACKRLAILYRIRFPYTPIIITDWMSAEFVKYMCNCFFATKISFMNEMKQASEKVDLDWKSILGGFLADGRIGNSHIDVPGHDGHPGFGGKCFPKDINAFINFFKDIEVRPSVLEAVWEKNVEVRDGADWEKIKGAISKK